MSTQDPTAGVPITVLPEYSLQHYRLLELPADLLELLSTSDHPPILQLKSKENSDGNAKDANAVLCTPEKTYDIRQVSSSNSVYLTKPHECADEGGGVPRTGIETVAKCSSTIELLPTKKQSAAPYIKAALPTYVSTGKYSSQNSTSRAELYSHIPLSQAECELGWSELACFESTSPQGCFVPSGQVKVQIWQAAITAATAEGTDLSSSFSKNDIPGYAVDLAEDWPTDLVAAVFAGVSQPIAETIVAVDKEKCIQFVGLSLLQARSEGRPTETAAFLKAWRDLMPESWRASCQLPVLKGSYTVQPGGNSITHTASVVDAKGAIVSPNDENETKTTLGAKRKWHEKFRASKRG
ncbi:uncharacterized protein RCC_00658 [Ramularia collo-cygni]|uniref:Sister chromatid cohesion protein Dcc1 n=1 Tax=Ramularia collo-cygni TaxID=112498 RepID=A0A2D3UPD0_9PEZI|nr:uncharacterized protein RCC_00658 [Ramularia collo-cygni]CZT14685.1 uncharacterized protein RCC_00658 [Ramularia collo-cygni]